MKYILFSLILFSTLKVVGQTKPNIYPTSKAVYSTRDLFAVHLVELYDQYRAFNKIDTLHPHFHRFGQYWADETCKDSLHICQSKYVKDLAEYKIREKEAEERKKASSGMLIDAFWLSSLPDKSMNTVRFYQKPMSFESFIEYLRKK